MLPIESSVKYNTYDLTAISRMEWEAGPQLLPSRRGRRRITGSGYKLTDEFSINRMISEGAQSNLQLK